MEKKNLGTKPIEVQWRLDQWFPELGPEILTKLKKLHAELLNFNKAVNLISVKTIPVADVIHFADCVLACRLIQAAKDPKEIYDFGSGNGFPGLIYAILFPKAKVKMVECDQRKAEYLKHCITQFNLSNAEVLIRNIETLPESSVGFAMSRGLAGIPKSLLMTRKVFKRGGIYFHLKSEEWATEVADIPSQLCSFWLPSLVSEYRLPVGSVKFAVVSTEKIAD